MEKLSMRKERNSSVELLKVITIFLIVISHSMPRYGTGDTVIDFNNASSEFDNFLMLIESYFGQIGNAIFITCSSWFLLDSNQTSSRKIKNIVLDTFFFSIVCCFCFIAGGFHIGLKTIIRQIFPITYGNNWYVGCYIVFYAVHPVLNKLIENINQRMYLTMVLCGLFLYSGIEFMLNKNSSTRYCSFVGFIFIYLLVGYVKKYMPQFCQNFKMNIILFCTAALSLVILIAITNILGLHIAYFSNKMGKWCRFNNPLIILIALSLFNVFNQKEFYSKIINEISSVTLLIYVIHDNILFRYNMKPLWWQFIYRTFTYKHAAGWTLVFAVICFAASVGIGLFYKKTIRNIIYKASDALFDKMCIWGNFVVDKLMERLH
jgi:surface polysaccharide O-acyltransferase-like enzyme